MTNIREGRAVTERLAFRVARLAGVPLEDVLEGRWPEPGTCAHCGRGPSGALVTLATE